MLQAMFDTRRQEMPESVLDENSVYLATEIARYVPKKLFKQLKYESASYY